MIGLAGALACVHPPPEPSVSVFHPPPPPAAPVGADGAVGAALDARPATPLPARLAVFAADAELSQRVAEGLDGLQGVAETWAVPGYLVDGRSRWAPYPTYPPRPLGEIDLERVREVAAMARSDLLLVVDRGSRETARPNAWLVLAPLVLFTPFLQVDDTSYLDASLVDVRTGYLYGTVQADRTDRRGPVTLYGLYRASVFERQLGSLIEQCRDQLADLLWYHLLDPE